MKPNLVRMLFFCGFIISIVHGNINAQSSPVSPPTKSYTESNFYGDWFTKVNEPINGNCTIEVKWKPNNTTSIRFIYESGKVIETSSKWKYTDPYYDEVFPDGTKGRAKIVWLSPDKFKLIILENQDTENYKNIYRIFERKK